MDQFSSNALSKGTRLHWYEVEAICGHGGFGITYLARERSTWRPVAIKEFFPAHLAERSADGHLRPTSLANAEEYAWGLERFLAEARTLARFDHPSIVRVLTVFEANGTAYMVMRYESGRSLAEILASGEALDQRRLDAILAPLLEGLEEVHAAGFIHRDIKPENVYVGDSGGPVLLDFGSARQALGRRTQSMTRLVSPGFAPLEQYSEDGEEQGPWTDIYALGATLYRVVTGETPIDAVQRSKGVLGSTRDVLPKAADVAAGGYRPGFLRAIDHALALNDQDRPRSIEALRRELLGDGDAARTGPRGDPGRGNIRWRWAAAALAAGVAAGMWLPSAMREILGAGAPPDPQARERRALDVRARDLEARAAALSAREAELAAARESLTRERGHLEKERAGLRASSTEIAARERALAERREGLERDLARSRDTAAALAAQRAQLDSEGGTLAERRAALTAAERGVTARERDLETRGAELLRAENELGRRERALAARGTDSAPPAPARAGPAAGAGSSAEVSFDEALAAYRRGDYAAALPAIRRYAEQGNLRARLALAASYIHGQGVKPDPAEGLRILHSLAEEGSAEAKFQIARMYAEGVGLPADEHQAFDWYRHAATDGYAAAQFEVGRAYELGRGPAQEFFLAYIWYSVAQACGYDAKAFVDRSRSKLQPDKVEMARRLIDSNRRKYCRG